MKTRSQTKKLSPNSRKQYVLEEPKRSRRRSRSLRRTSRLYVDVLKEFKNVKNLSIKEIEDLVKELNKLKF